MNITMVNAQPRHRPALEGLLTSLALPTTDLPDELPYFVLAYDGDSLVGSAGVEHVGPYGLLRSVAVAESHRNLGLAEKLFTASIGEARRHGLTDIWLITTSADRYFERHGFERIDRAAVPAEIAGTSQFSELCPSSAVVMRRRNGE